MKLFSINNTDIVESCQEFFFCFDLPSVQLSKRVEKFVTTFTMAYIGPVLLLCLSVERLYVLHTVFNLVKILVELFSFVLCYHYMVTKDVYYNAAMNF